VDENRTPLHLNVSLTRSQFEKMVADLIDQTLGPCRQALEDAKLQPTDVDEILLVGGSIRVPAVQEAVRRLFGKEPNLKINPDEAVAVGAAIQAGILSGEGELKDVLLLDVTPLSLGIETLGGVCTKLITRNTTIPTRKSEVFTTAADNQPEVTVHVLQGEREMASHNRTLGRFNLTGIPPAPRGVPQIEVTFDIDANGIVHVSAKDLGTGREQSIRIEASSGLTEEEIQEMVKNAEAHAEEDRKARDLATAHNELDTLVYTSEKALREHGDKVPENERKQVQDAIERAKKTLEGQDVDAMKQATQDLSTAAHKLAEIMYRETAASQGQQAQAGPEPQPGPTESGEPKTTPTDEGVVDADYTVEDDDSKK